MFLKPVDKFLIALVTVIFLGGSFLAWFLFGEIVILPMMAVMLGLLGAFIIEAFRRLEHKQLEMQKEAAVNYRQTEALFNLHSNLGLRRPLPQMKGFTVFPDFAALLVGLIKETRPKLVVELGSGVSTVIAAYCLEELGSGKVLSMEHETKYAAVTRRHLRTHGLERYAKVIHAPLEELNLGGRSWKWYDKSKFRGINNIDMLVVDGPPGPLQKLSRYPALPVLAAKMAPGAVVVLEDAKRKDERQIVKMWRTEFKDIGYEFVDTHKGAAVLRRPAK